MYEGQFDDEEGLDDDLEGDFICPECGSEEMGDHLLVSPANPDGADPWSCVTEIMRCGKCWSWIPAFVAKRRGGMSLERANEEWRDIYRQGGISKRRWEEEARRPQQSSGEDRDDGADW